MNDYVCVIGGINIDIKGISDTSGKEPDSHPGKIYFTPGGVARNVSENLARLDIPVYLLGCVGDDYFGNFIIDKTRNKGVNTDNIIKSSSVSTSKYLSVSSNNGNLHYAVNDMKESSELITPEYILKNKKIFENSKLIVADTNLSPESLNKVVSIANDNNIPVFIDTVSSAKASIVNKLQGRIEYLSPNLLENENLFGNYDKMSEILTTGIFKNFGYIILKKGIEGVTIIDVENERSFEVDALSVDVVEPNGAGDAFNAGFIYSIIRNYDVQIAARVGICAAHITLKSEKSVSDELTQKNLLDLYNQKISENEF
jgi:pseudouridine kinase